MDKLPFGDRYFQLIKCAVVFQLISSEKLNLARFDLLIIKTFDGRWLSVFRDSDRQTFFEQTRY